MPGSDNALVELTCSEEKPGAAMILESAVLM